jgi:hypothetical protein
MDSLHVRLPSGFPLIPSVIVSTNPPFNVHIKVPDGHHLCNLRYFIFNRSAAKLPISMLIGGGLASVGAPGVVTVSVAVSVVSVVVDTGSLSEAFFFFGLGVAPADGRRFFPTIIKSNSEVSERNLLKFQEKFFLKFQNFRYNNIIS